MSRMRLWPLLKLNNKLYTHEGKLYVTDKTVRETFPDLPYKRVCGLPSREGVGPEFPKGSGEAHMRSGHAPMHV
jgi:hypothetical protein